MTLGAPVALFSPFGMATPPSSFGSWTIDSDNTIAAGAPDAGITVSSVSVDDEGIIQRILKDGVGNTYIQLINAEGQSGDDFNTAGFSDENYVKMNGSSSVASRQRLENTEPGNLATPVTYEMNAEMYGGDFKDPNMANPFDAEMYLMETAVQPDKAEHLFTFTRAHDPALNEDYEHTYIEETYEGPVYAGVFQFAKKDVANGTADDYEYIMALDGRKETADFPSLDPAELEGVPRNTNLWVKTSGAATHTGGTFGCDNGTSETWAAGDQIWYTKMLALVDESPDFVESYGHELFQNDTATGNQDGPHFDTNIAGATDNRPGDYWNAYEVTTGPQECSLNPADIFDLDAPALVVDPFNNPVQAQPIPHTDPTYNP